MLLLPLLLALLQRLYSYAHVFGLLACPSVSWEELPSPVYADFNPFR